MWLKCSTAVFCLSYCFVAINAIKLDGIDVGRVYSPYYRQADDAEWDYNNIDQWGDDYPACNGRRQSPISLNNLRSLYMPRLSDIELELYRERFPENLEMINNGHTINIPVPTFENGSRPYITGGPLTDEYEAQSVHFHWGNLMTNGSEHMLYGERHHVEMHIVHKNKKYGSMEEAQEQRDGLAVLGIFIEGSDNYPTVSLLNNVLEQLPNVREYQELHEISMPLSLKDLFRFLDHSNYFTYQGSLTTPPCYESVTWIVFSETVKINAKLVPLFWEILDKNGNTYTNYRPLQKKNFRRIDRSFLF